MLLFLLYRSGYSLTYESNAGHQSHFSTAPTLVGLGYLRLLVSVSHFSVSRQCSNTTHFRVRMYVVGNTVENVADLVNDPILHILSWLKAVKG